MPNLFVIAGSNGSGKTTIAQTLLPNYFNCNEFVNADLVAAGIAPKDIASVAITAGKKTLGLVEQLFEDGMSFAIETTLSGRVHERMIKRAQQLGYYVILIYIWVRSPSVSISRVKSRVKLGGHFISTDDVIRRYRRGIVNLFRTYMDVCNYWAILDNSEQPQKIVAEGTGTIDPNVLYVKIWNRMKSEFQKYGQ